jgi:S-methylmethionine-dependent homocysteine/selenocysteine methylase
MKTVQSTGSPDPTTNMMNLPGPVALLDGSMGQELINRGVGGEGQLWAADALFHSPGTVLEVHLDYIAAGADIITTNSYSTIRHKFEIAGLVSRFEEMNRLSGELAVAAKKKSGKNVLIAGSLPPQRGSYRPDLVGDFAEIEPLYREQALLLAPYVDFYLCETMSSSQEARAAVSGASIVDKPVFVSWTIADQGEPRLRSGETIKCAYSALTDIDVSGYFLNCSSPEAIGRALPELLNLSNLPVGAYANAFTPIPGKWSYQSDEDLPPPRTDLGPEAYAVHATDWIKSGASMIGGCCEVGPVHIAKLRRMIDGL